MAVVACDARHASIAAAAKMSITTVAMTQRPRRRPVRTEAGEGCGITGTACVPEPATTFRPAGDGTLESGGGARLVLIGNAPGNLSRISALPPSRVPEIRQRLSLRSEIRPNWLMPVQGSGRSRRWVYSMAGYSAHVRES